MSVIRADSIKTLAIDKVAFIDNKTNCIKRECLVLRDSSWHILGKEEWEKLKSEIDYFYNNVLEDDIEQANQEIDSMNSESKVESERTKTKGYVYIIQSEPYGFIKIGRTIDISSRFKTLAVQLPFKVKLLGFIETDDYVGLENQLHIKYLDKRINGEWFELDDNELRDLMKLVNV